MNWTWLRSALVTSTLLLPTAAWAATGTGSSTGGSGTGGSDTGTGGTGGTGGTDTGTGGTSSDTGGSSTGEMCPECLPSTDVVQIVSPADGATVTPTLDVNVTAPYTCRCGPRPPFSVSLRVDGMTVTSCQSDAEGCDTENMIFTVGLMPGTHTLDAAADVDGQAQFSDPIEVTVPGEVGGDTTGSPPPPPPPPPPATSSSGDSGSGGSGSGAADGGGGGCGCHTGPRGPAGMLAGLLVLLGLGTRRRRQS